MTFTSAVGKREYSNYCRTRTIPTGQTAGNDYSKWKYTFTPAYVGTIREGINRITAKLLCQANPVNLTKFYSINVTGTSNVAPNNITRDAIIASITKE